MNAASMPHPGDGPEFHADFSAWVERNVSTIDDAVAVVVVHRQTTDHGVGCACLDPVFRKLRRRYSNYPEHKQALALLGRRAERW